MIGDINNSASSAREYAEALRDAVTASSEARQNFSDMAASLSQAAISNREFASGYRTASQDARNLSRDAQKLAQYNSEDLKTTQGRRALERDLAKLAQDKAQAERTIEANRRRMVNATDRELVALSRQNIILQDAVNEADSLTNAFTLTGEQIEKINSNTEWIDKLADGVSTIPGIGNLLSTPLKNLSKGIAEFQVGIDDSLTGADRTRAQFERINNVTDALGKGSLLLIAKSLFDADSATTNLAKGLGVSKAEAKEIKQDFESIALNSGKSYLTGVKFAAAMGELGAEIGAVAGFTADQLQSQIELTKLAGLQSSEAAGLVEFGILQNKEQSQVTSEILDQVVALEKESGIRLDGRKVLAEVAKINGQLGAQYGYNTAEIARAVIQANKLGLSLKDTQGIAKNLLQFESSIANELEAELLIGRDLNLEKARLLALNGDSAGAAAEMAKQFGSAEEFTRLNVIQQESLAQAMGMSVDQMADSLRKQEVLNSLGAENIEQLAEQGRLEELRTTKTGETVYQQYLQQSAADKFSDAMTKIQSAIGTIVEGPLGGLIDGMASLANSAGAVYTALALIGTISLARTIGSLVTMAISLGTSAAFASATSAALTLGLSAAAIVGAIALVGYAASSAADKSKQIATEDDMIMPSGYGDRILSTPKGSIALNNQDTIVAGTNLGGGGNSESRRTNQLLEMILSKQGVVKMDSVNVGTAFSMNTYQVQ